jgi:hypothetical protein
MCAPRYHVQVSSLDQRSTGLDDCSLQSGMAFPKHVAPGALCFKQKAVLRSDLLFFR